jgi:translation elongation factor EF-4
MLLIDSWYDNYKGVILLVRIFDGVLKPGDQIISFVTRKKYLVGEVGIMHPLETATSSLRAGQVGYCYFNPGMKKTSEAKIGDTLTHMGFENEVVPCEGFEEPQPMVYYRA